MVRVIAKQYESFKHQQSGTEFHGAIVEAVWTGNAGQAGQYGVADVEAETALEHFAGPHVAHLYHIEDGGALAAEFIQRRDARLAAEQAMQAAEDAALAKEKAEKAAAEKKAAKK